MRWGAVVLAAVCLVAVGCSDDKPTDVVEGVLIDPIGDVVITGPVDAAAQRADIEAVLIRADEKQVRIKVLTPSSAGVEVVRERVVVELWDDSDPPKRLFGLDTRDHQAVMACLGNRPAVCSEPLDGATAAWGDGFVLIDVPRPRLPAITSATRWRVERVYERNAGGLFGMDVVGEVPALVDRSVAFFKGDDAGTSGVDAATVVVQANGKLRVLIDDAPAGDAAVRVFRAGEDAPVATLELTFRQGEDVDREVGRADMPAIPPLWEVEIETSRGRTRRVAAVRM